MLVDEINNHCLFRYRNFNDNTLDEILTGNVWHSKPSLLNDPFEFNFEFDWENFTMENFVYINKRLGIFPQDVMEKLYLGDESFRYNFFEILQSEVERVISERKEQLENVTFVCCFASSPDNPLMWSHYSNGMQGLCIAYKKDILKESEDFKRIIPVKYVESPFKISYEQLGGERLSLETTPHAYDFTKKSDNPAEIELKFSVYFKSYNYIFQKHSRWSYEGEHRNLAIDHTMNNSAGCLKKVGTNSISSIIFGYRMSKTNIRILELICRSKNIKMFRAIPRKSDYSVIIQEHFF